MKLREIEFPDTLYLPDRAALALNCLTRALDKGNDYLPYCLMDLSSDPPKMIHEVFDWSDHTARVLDAIQLVRHMTGLQDGQEAEERLRHNLDARFGADGLHYTPDSPISYYHANMHYQRSVLLYLVGSYLINPAPETQKRIDDLCQGLKNVSIKGRGFWYFPATEYFPTGWREGDWRLLGWGADPAHTNGRQIDPLVRYYLATGSTVALELAENFARHVVDHSNAFGPDGSFNTGLEFREGHFHSRAVTMTGVLRYAHATNNARMLEWGRRAYEWAKSQGTEYGWFPERLIEEKGHGCETCAITDMIQSAIILAQAGHTQYWNDAERFVRNQLAESQLLDISWMKPAAKPVKDTAEVGYEDVGERCLGGFVGWSQPNDLLSKVMHNWDLYMCCCGAGVRGLFLAWNNICTDEGRRLKVNLLLNQANPQVTVRSHLPYAGKVEVELHQARELMVRIPNWVSRLAVKAEVAGAPVSFSWLDDYVVIPDLSAGDQVTVEFPVKSRTSVERVWGEDYKIEWKGDTVIGVSPEGPVVPLYQRSSCRQGTAPVRTFRHFEPDNRFVW